MSCGNERRAARFSRLICATLAASFCSSVAAFDVSYWAWQRSEALTETERAQLSNGGVRTLYWQIGELENRGATWRWKAHFDLPSNERACLRFVPVVRIESREKSPFTAASLQALKTALSAAVRTSDELQLDYDAPDRLLSDYAAALKSIHSIVPKLSITALPHWSRRGLMDLFVGAVDEMVPMLYDFEPDPVVAGALPIPLIVPEKTERWIAEWSACKIPWRAGVPAFARVTVFDPSGASRGHIREWSWDDVCFNHALVTTKPSELGTTSFRATAPTRAGEGLIRKDQVVVARWADRAGMTRMIAAVGKTSARGIVFFRLPDSTDPSGWSLAQLEHLDAAPRVVLRPQADTRQVELCNESDGDLEPRLSEGTDDRDRGYALQIEADAAIFRDAHEGDFWRLVGHAEGANRSVAIPLATRLTFWFSHLRARKSLRTGPIQLAPGQTLLHTRFRILNLPGDSEWKNIEPPNPLP